MMSRLTIQPLQWSLLEEMTSPLGARQTAGSIERSFEVPFVARLALKEKQIQQNVRPIIAVHKWFARRPGTLFRSLLLAEFADGPLSEAYFRPHRLKGIRVADPFMGGGTPLFEANRLGCDVTGWDVNPMAYWIVRQEIEHLDLHDYRQAAERIGEELEAELGSLYRTQCTSCGEDAPVKYFHWVKVQLCTGCGQPLDLFPGYLLAADDRHPRNVVICADCGALAEVEDREVPGCCPACGVHLRLEGPARRGRCECRRCGVVSAYPAPHAGPPRHRMVALEYHCFRCKPHRRGRFFKQPAVDDLERYREAEERWTCFGGSAAPADPIPAGDETDRLRRWGYNYFREMFNPRQLLALSHLARRITQVGEVRSRHALATNLSDLLRYQNMLCRYDTRSLKSLDIFSVHGFPVGLIQCESNFLGIRHPRRDSNIGSGGWSNVVEKFIRAKEYCERPFEIRYDDRGKKQFVPMPGEWIGDRSDGPDRESRRVDLRCGSAADADLAGQRFDAVLTDPPYYANVQYAELMDFCYAWLRRLISSDDPAFHGTTTRRGGDLTGNQTLERGLEHFVSGLSAVFGKLSDALVPGRPFVFTYHHNSLEAYRPVVVALLDAGLVCTESLPCPAEMGGSIHIHSSESSIVDTVFVCRSTGTVSSRLLSPDSRSLASRVREDLDLLRKAGVEVTRGDARCIAFGHLTRISVWRLRQGWSSDSSWESKLERVGQTFASLASWEEIASQLEESGPLRTRSGLEVREDAVEYAVEEVEIAF